MHFTWFELIPSLRQYPEHVVMLAFTTILLVGISLFAKAVAGKPEDALVPDGKFTFRGLFEIIVESLHGMAESVLGHDASIYLPVMGSLFIYIFFNNIMGLVPGFAPATDNLNTTLSIGLVSFVLYNIEGMRAHGAAYLKHFLGPVLALAPLLLIIELVSHLVRPFSLGLRLRGNMFGDHTVLTMFLNLVPIGVPVVFYALGLFVCFIQAFVFTLLSMVYLQMATAHDH